MSTVRHRLRVIEAALLLCAAGLALSVLPFRLVARYAGIEKQGTPLALTYTRLTESQEIGRAVQAAARRLPWHPVCLPQALTAAWMLRRRGQVAQICFGIQRDQGRIKAHAWVNDSDGTVCGGAQAADFVPIAMLQGRSN